MIFVEIHFFFLFSELYSRPALNTGKLGPLTSRFPFSYSITNLLNGKSTRNQLEQLFEKKKGQPQEQDQNNVVVFFQEATEIMKKMCVSFFGEEMVESWSGGGRTEGEKEGEGLDYFYDMVGMCGFPAANLSQDDEVLLFKTVMRGVTGKRQLVTPYEIHAAFLLSEVDFLTFSIFLFHVFCSDRFSKGLYPKRCVSCLFSPSSFPRFHHHFPQKRSLLRSSSLLFLPTSSYRPPLSLPK